MSQFKTIKLSIRRQGVAQITMSRVEVFNAFDEIMIAELSAVFAQLVSDETVRIIVLAGDGKHFSAGADLKWMQRASQESQEWNLKDARFFAKMLADVAACPKPTIARIQGVALGGGVGLLCACDIAIASDNAQFSVSEAKFGIIPSVIGPHLINAVGKREAKRLALTTARINTYEALRIGLLHEIVELDRLDEHIDTTIGLLLAGGPNAQLEIKKLYAQLDMNEATDAIIELTAQTISRVRKTDEAREGFDAFLDKRPASWIPS